MKAFIDVAPSELAPGDIVLVNGTRARVSEEVMTMHRGLGPFDDFQLLIGARIDWIGQPGSTLWTWRPTERVAVLRTQPPRSQPLPRSPAAVDPQDVTGDARGRIAGEVAHSPGDVLNASE